MKKIIFVTIFLTVTFLQATVPSSPASAAKPSSVCNAYILTFPAWYNGIVSGSKGNCSIMSPSDFSSSGDSEGQFKTYAGIIGLNILNILIQLVSYICAGFIIYGGYKYMVSAGDSSGVAAGKKTILNALIGLILSLFAVIVVSFAAGKIGIS